MYESVKWKIPLIVILVAGVIWLAWPPEKKMVLDESLAGGTELVYRFAKGTGSAEAERTKAVITKRLDYSGLTDIKIIPSGDTLIIKLPGLSGSEVNRRKNLIENMGVLTWKVAARDEAAFKWKQAAWDDAKKEWRPNVQPPPAHSVHVWSADAGRPNGADRELLEDASYVRGSNITGVRPDFNEAGEPVVAFQLNSDGKAELAKIASRENVGRRLVILLNGEVVSDPVLQSALTEGSGIITLGGGDRADVERRRDDLMATIQAGTLQSKLELLYQFTTGVGLGKDQIDRGKRTIIIAFVCVVAFMAMYYLGAGLVANVALVLNMVLVIGMMCAFRATFTLPGIAGLVLTIGMAVDANILIYERIREEKAKGKPLRQAVKNGFDRAFLTIFDSNVTTLITAAILYWMGSVEIKGFAVTLSLGLMCNMFTALVVTKVIFTLLIRSKIFRSVKMFKLIGVPGIPFVKLGPYAVIGSCILIAIGLAATVARGEKNFGIDFLGGSRYQIVLRNPMEIAQVRSRVAREVRDADIQEIEPMGEAAAGGGGSVRKNTEFVITVSQLELARLGNMYKDRYPQLGGKSHEIVKNEIKGLFADLAVPEGWLGEGVMPEEGRISFQMRSDLSGKEKADVRAILERLGYGSEEVAFTAGEQTKEFVLSGVNLETKGFADRVAEIRTALAGNEPSLLLSEEPKLDADTTSLFFTAAVEVYEESQRDPDAMTKALQALLDAGASKGGPGGTPPVRRTVQSVAVDAGGQAWDPNARNFVKVTAHVASSALTSGTRRSLLEEQEEIARLLRDRVSPGALAREETIGTTIAQSFRRDAFFSLVLSFAAIICYIWMRFRHFRYGLAAVIALIHDVLFTLGSLAVMSYLGLDIKIDLTIIAAFLTLVGFSLNDTIVLFDRIRENTAGRHPRHYVADVNLSINQTLSRTFLTSFTVLMTVVIMAALGGGIMRGFALSMLVGVTVGTYSTIFIASPVAVWFHNRELEKKGIVVVPGGVEQPVG